MIESCLTDVACSNFYFESRLGANVPERNALETIVLGVLSTYLAIVVNDWVKLPPIWLRQRLPTPFEGRSAVD